MISIICPQGKFLLSREYIASTLAQSLLDDALQIDPEATEIVIPNPLITPEVMEIIVNYAERIEPEKHNTNLCQAHHYLNIPWLLYYADPLYDRIPNRLDIKDPINADIWRQSIEQDGVSLVEYYLVKGWNPTNDDFLMAVEWGADKVVKVLLENTQIDPAVNNNFGIRWAAGQGYSEIVRLLLRDVRVDSLDEALIAAARKGQVEVMRLLLANERVNPAAMDNLAIIEAAETGQLEAVKILLSDERVNPADADDAAIRSAAQGGHTEVVQLLLSDPRVDPAASNNEALKLAAARSRLNVIRLLLADERVNPAVDNNYTLRYALRYGRQDVVDLLKADPRVQAVGF